MACRHCGGIARYRLLGLLLANYLHNDCRFRIDLDRGLSLAAAAVPSGFRMLDTSYSSSLHPFLGHRSHYEMSEYLPQLGKGGSIFGIRHEDLMDLSLEDGCLDCIVTSEVFEHIADPARAFAQVKRVLKPGGIHLFTVPLHLQMASTTRARHASDGTVQHLLPPVYHRNPLSLRGALVYTDFGADLAGVLNDAGLETHCITISDHRLALDTTALVSVKV